MKANYVLIDYENVQVYAALVKHGYVKVNGAKVTYALPAAQVAV